MSIGRRLRRALACTAAFGACASLSACGAADADRDPDTLVILTTGDERVLGPQWDMATRFLAFLPLAEESEDGTLRGVLARSWEHSPDYLEWTIRLRGDVRWHDGTPFTAHDVKFSLDFEDRQEVEAGLPARREVTVLDDTTYVARYRQIPNYPVSTWNVFYPRHLLDGLDTDAFYASDFWTQPVGNGPYRYVRHVPSTLLELGGESRLLPWKAAHRQDHPALRPAGSERPAGAPEGRRGHAAVDGSRHGAQGAGRS